jgi:hypothetical protein
MWPAFIAAIVIDAIIGHALPPSGDAQSVTAAVLLGAFLNLGAVVLLSVPIGYFVRRARPDLPKVVARDYGGTLAIAGVTLALLFIGLAHRPSVVAERQAMRDAIVRAQAFIGDRAPDEYRRNLTMVDTVVIEPRAIYRVCVNSAVRPRTYCVIVRRFMPFGSSVSFAGYEPNTSFAAGTG